MKKQLKDLNLLDRFLFAQAIEDPATMKDMLDIILGQDISLKSIQTEKESRKSPETRSVRLDVYAVDEDGALYNTEVQKKNTYNIPNRSRLYQGMIDVNQLPAGTVDFNDLKDAYVILIAPFDLFGKGLYRYTFHMACDEVDGLKLNDGATRIFLNTRGTNADGVSQELIELLHYMEHTTDEVSQVCTSNRIHQLNKRINEIKSNEEIGVKFVQAWEEKLYERQAGIEIGEERAKKVYKLFGAGKSPEEIAKECNLSLEKVKQILE